MTGNPVVAAEPGHRGGHGATVRPTGLTLLDELDDRLPGHHRVDAVRAHFHEMAGDVESAVRYYRAAAARTTSVPEQRYLNTRAARVAFRSEM